MDPKQKGKSGFTIWLSLVIIGVLLATFIPYGILTTLAPSLAIYGFWLGFGVSITLLIFWAVKDWKNEK